MSEFSRTLTYDIYNYQRRYNEEVNPILMKQLEEEQDLVTRKNFQGHVTGSCYVINDDGTKILLLHHKKLNKLLQPGGHVDDGERVIEGAIRELEEETGLKEYEIVDKIPFFINTHTIPKIENESEHLHHDFVYLVKVANDDVKVDENESQGYKWVPLEDFLSDDLIERLQNLL